MKSLTLLLQRRKTNMCNTICTVRYRNLQGESWSYSRVTDQWRSMSTSRTFLYGVTSGMYTKLGFYYRNV